MKNMLTIITGPMYSGKSSQLIKFARTSSIAKIKLVAFKPLIDKRYNENDVMTHDEFSFEKATGIKPINLELDLSNFNSKFIPLGTEEIYIDEVQFFDKEKIIEFIFTLIQMNFKVFCSGLDLDRFGKPFGAVPDLLCLADEIIKLKAVCFACHKSATKTYREEIDNNSNTIVVGGMESYKALCNKCWFKATMIKEFNFENKEE
jgi:thymidine kinase